jgi:hypothetical protein
VIFTFLLGLGGYSPTSFPRYHPDTFSLITGINLFFNLSLEIAPLILPNKESTAILVPCESERCSYDQFIIISKRTITTRNFQRYFQQNYQ